LKEVWVKSGKELLPLPCLDRFIMRCWVNYARYSVKQQKRRDTEKT